MLKLWNEKNYGRLSETLRRVFTYETNVKKHPRICRELFGNKNLTDYKLVKVEERGCSLLRLVVEVFCNEDLDGKVLEFGCIYVD